MLSRKKLIEIFEMNVGDMNILWAGYCLLFCKMSICTIARNRLMRVHLNCLRILILERNIRVSFKILVSLCFLFLSRLILSGVYK